MSHDADFNPLEDSIYSGASGLDVYFKEFTPPSSYQVDGWAPNFLTTFSLKREPSYVSAYYQDGGEGHVRYNFTSKKLLHYKRDGREEDNNEDLSGRDITVKFEVKSR